MTQGIMKAIRYAEAGIGLLFLIAFVWDGRLPMAADSPGIHHVWNIVVFPLWMKVAEVALCAVFCFDAVYGLRRMNTSGRA
jgi:hypothetical protein